MLTTIAIKRDTYRQLNEIKKMFGFKSYDDVVKTLLDCYIKSAEPPA